MRCSNIFIKHENGTNIYVNYYVRFGDASDSLFTLGGGLSCAPGCLGGEPALSDCAHPIFII